jgi:hypothetical protein
MNQRLPKKQKNLKSKKLIGKKTDKTSEKGAKKNPDKPGFFIANNLIRGQ